MKPHAFEKLVEIAHQIQARWLTPTTPDETASPARSPLQGFALQSGHDFGAH
jgi:hypothetical protein